MREEALDLPGAGRVLCRWAETPWERARGLIGRPPLPAGAVMGFRRCRALHTCFMGRAIDVLFVDRAGVPVRFLPGVKPWRLLVWGGWRAATAYEGEAGSMAPPDARARRS